MFGKLRLLAIGLAGLALLAAPGVASAAIVTNGDFETGDLSGWHDEYVNPEVGHWFNYTGTSSPLEDFTISAPPQGTHAVVADEGDVSRQILYQDVTLPPGGSAYQLSLLGYYSSPEPDFVSPDTLSLDVENEQYRIDVVKPSAPVDSVSSGDVLRNLLRTTESSPEDLAPTQLTADLSAYAGQTVRIRLAVVTTEHTLNGSADAIAVRWNGFSVGTAVRNKKKGTAVVPVTVPDPGTLALSGNGVKARSFTVQGGTTNLPVKVKGKKKRKLNRKGKAKASVTITYTPTGLSGNSQSTKVKLKKKRKKK